MISKLGEIGQIITGNTPKTADIENYSSNDIMFIKPSDIQEDKLITLSQSEFYISEKARKKARVLPPGCILVTCIGIVGKVAINSCECAFNQQINAIIPNIEKCNTKYLAYAIQNQKQKLQDIANAAVVPILNKTQFSEIEITLPPLEEQHRIAALLDKVSDLIAKRRAQLDKLDLLVKARFVEMFGDPVRNNRGWDTDRLDNLCNGIGDGLHGTPEYDENGRYPFINGNNLIDGKIVITDATKRINEKEYKKLFIEISKNAILISINGTLGKLAFYNGESVALGKSACYCNLRDEISRRFIYGIMESDAFADFMEEVSTKSTIKNVGLKAMREFKVIRPPAKLQNQFGAFVEHKDKSKLTIQRSLDKLETLKKALMQQYFGG